jgi:Spy/CpxP family protein refolding chaperone
MASAGVVGELGTRARKRHLSREVAFGLVLLLVGCAGVAVGVAIDRLVLYRYYGADVMTDGTGGGTARRLARELDLSPAQQVKIDSIIARQMTAYDSLRNEYQPRVRALMLGTRAAIDSILTPPQRERLRAMSRGRDQT